MNSDIIEKIKAAFPSSNMEDWKEKIEKELKGTPFESIEWKPEENLKINPFYNRPPERKYEFPENKKVNWEIVEKIASKEIKEANSLALQSLNSGANSLYFELKIRNYSSFKQLLQGILIQHISVHFLVENQLEVLNFLDKYVAENNISPSAVRGSIIGYELPNSLIGLQKLSEKFPMLRTISISTGKKTTLEQLDELTKKGEEVVKRAIEKGKSAQENG